MSRQHPPAKSKIGLVDTPENRLRVYIAAFQTFAGERMPSAEMVSTAINVVYRTFDENPR